MILFVRAAKSSPGDHSLFRGDQILFVVMHIAFAARRTFEPMDCCVLAPFYIVLGRSLRRVLSFSVGCD